MQSIKASKRDSVSFGQSSDDSKGSDSSYFSNSEEENKEPRIKGEVFEPSHSLDELKFKHKKYIEYRNKINQKKKEIENDNNLSLWSSLYYSFLKNSKTKPMSITLNEINLRCKFLFNMDLSEKKKKKRTYTQDNILISPYTNLAQLIKYFSERDYETSVSKYISRSKSAISKKQTLKIIPKENLEIQSTAKRKPYNILNMYNIIEPNEIISHLNKKINFYPKEEEYKQKLENMNFILNNKHAFQVELNNFNNVIQNNGKMLNLYNYFLDLKTSENFFSERQNSDLIKKYQKTLHQQDKLGMQINSFCNKVINKLDPLQMLDF